LLIELLNQKLKRKHCDIDVKYLPVLPATQTLLHFSSMAEYLGGLSNVPVISPVFCPLAFFATRRNPLNVAPPGELIVTAHQH